MKLAEKHIETVFQGDSSDAGVAGCSCTCSCGCFCQCACTDKDAKSTNTSTTKSGNKLSLKHLSSSGNIATSD